MSSVPISLSLVSRTPLTPRFASNGSRMPMYSTDSCYAWNVTKVRFAFALVSRKRIYPTHDFPKLVIYPSRIQSLLLPFGLTYASDTKRRWREPL